MTEQGKYINREAIRIGRVAMIGSTVRDDGLMLLAEEDEGVFGYGWDAGQEEIDDILAGSSEVLRPVTSFRIGPYVDRQAFLEAGLVRVEDKPVTVWFKVPRVLIQDQKGE